MITCDVCYVEFIPEPDVTFIGSEETLKGEPEKECTWSTSMVCLCEKCYDRYKQNKGVN